MGNDITIKNNGITYHIFGGVKPQSQKVIEDVFSDIQSKSWKNKEFFDDLNINLYSQWGDSEEFSDLDYSVKGFVNYPVINESKTINLTTNRSVIYEPWSMFNRRIRPNKLKSYALHELGHLFDFNFADSDEAMVCRLRTLINKLTGGMQCSDEEIIELDELCGKYFDQNGLSDSEAFKEAWRKDLNIAFKGKSSAENKKLNRKLDYFSPKYFDDTDEYKNKYEIILEDGVSDDEIILGDDARQEIFAQLFAYAMGACDDKKRKSLIVNTYKHSYEVVKGFINEHLGTNTTGHYVPRASRKLDCNM